MSDLPDEMKLRLSTNVGVRHPDSGRLVVFGPDDDVPRWARDQIGAHAWGYEVARSTRPVTNTGHEGRRDQHGRPNFIDVVCSAKHPRRTADHPRRIVARFETTLLVGYRPGPGLDDADGWAAREVWDWCWTTQLLRGGVDTATDGHPIPITRGRRDGERWVFEPTGEDPGERHAVVHDLKGDKVVRLRCCGFNLLRRWEHWLADLNGRRHAGVAEVELSDLVRTMTT